MFIKADANNTLIYNLKETKQKNTLFGPEPYLL